MNNIFEQCAIDGELTPELLKRKQELDQSMEAELSEIEADKGNKWLPKEKHYAEIRQKYEDAWEQELTDAGYVVRPIFESIEKPTFEDWYEELSKLHEALQTYRITYYEDGVKKSFTVQASSKAEAEQIGWSKVDADSLYVSE